jgi:hypothetical protein
MKVSSLSLRGGPERIKNALLDRWLIGPPRFQVLNPDEIEQRLPEGIVIRRSLSGIGTHTGEEHSDLCCDCVINVNEHQLRFTWKEKTVDGEEPLQLENRVDMIVDTKINSHVAVTEVATTFTDNKDACGLSSTPVSPSTITSEKRIDQPGRQISIRGLKGSCHRIEHLGTGKDVALACETGPGPPSGPIETLSSRESRCNPVAVHDADLPMISTVVASGKYRDDFRGGQSLVEQI